MQTTIFTALHKALDLVGTTIQKVTKITKPQFKFFVWLLERWWMLPVRYNFLTLSRYGGYSDRTIREQFAKPLPFVELLMPCTVPCSKRNVSLLSIPLL